MPEDDWFAQVVRELEASPPGTTVVRTFRYEPGVTVPELVAGFRTLGNCMAQLPLPPRRRSFLERLRDRLKCTRPGAV